MDKYPQLQKQGVVLLGIDVNERSQNIDSFLQSTHFNITWPILLDKHKDVSLLYNEAAYPMSVFIDRKGIIRSIVVGGLDPTTFPNQLATILNS